MGLNPGSVNLALVTSPGLHFPVHWMAILKPKASLAIEMLCVNFILLRCSVLSTASCLAVLRYSALSSYYCFICTCVNLCILWAFETIQSFVSF